MNPSIFAGLSAVPVVAIREAYGLVLRIDGNNTAVAQRNAVCVVGPS